MNTEKKNQHYIPKFYLRNFSFQGNKKQIGVFNLNNGIFVEKGSLKAQGSRNFFYGCDGIIEDGLSEIEGILSKVLRNIIESKEIPPRGSDEHRVLLSFVALTHLRNPVMIEGLKNSIAALKNRVKELDSTADTSKLVGDLSHEQSVVLALSNLPGIVKFMMDLDCKLLINKTSSPFLSSDFPIVQYNQFLEERKWKHGLTGYGKKGLQIFIPINSEITLLIYDSMIYKIGSRKKQICEIHDSDDVDSINILQFINCFDTVFFDDKASEQYIRYLNNKSHKFSKANQTKSQLSYIVTNEEDRDFIESTGKNNLVMIGITDCETKLKLSIIKLISGTNYLKLDSTIAQLRPWPASLKD